MKKYFFSIAACFMLLATSCTTVTKTATTASVDNIVATYPTVADLEVKSKISQSMSWSFAPFHWGEPKLTTAKGNLVSETLKALNADVLLEAQFMFQKTSYGERTLTVTGFPATYKNFRKASDKDLDALKACGTPNEEIHYNDGCGGLFGVFKKK
ncbi:MAG: hypothetical protein ACI3Y5_03525 [Prevotella sp.]